MIYNLTLNDRTQKIVLRELETTEKLLSKVATKLSSTQKTCDIYAMTDLGIAHNVTRMRGGFFTGAVYSWEQTDIPFVPVDTTVNVCGTALYQINSDIQVDEFKKRCENVLSDILKVISNWYYSAIKTETGDNHCRYLQYIEGSKTEQFYKMAKMLETFNAERNYDFCKGVLKNEMGKEILNVAHYGMPSIHEVLIGVQKTDGLATLLTSPGKNVYIVKKRGNFKNDYIPHGFGLELPKGSKLAYHRDYLEIGGKQFTSNGITIGEDAINRHGSSEKDSELREYVKKIAQINELEICAELKQVCSFSAKGFQVWR